jgi:1-acyl-sn-glycerol-3-phosphate acyltransferase
MPDTVPNAIAQDAPFLYRLLQGAVLALLRILTKIDIEGSGYVPSSGPLIVAPNHIHLLDSMIAFAVTPRRVTALAADKWRTPPIGCLLTLIGQAIYVTRGEADRRAIAKAIAVLRSGGALGVAPEGTRSSTGGLQRGKDGAAYLASRAGAVIVPMAAWGQEKMLRAWAHLHRPAIHVRFGEPIRLPEGAERTKMAQLGVYTDEIMLALARLLPAEYRGAYASRL